VIDCILTIDEMRLLSPKVFQHISQDYDLKFKKIKKKNKNQTGSERKGQRNGCAVT
jgi:hypothetical protein